MDNPTVTNVDGALALPQFGIGGNRLFTATGPLGHLTSLRSRSGTNTTAGRHTVGQAITGLSLARLAAALLVHSRHGFPNKDGGLRIRRRLVCRQVWGISLLGDGSASSISGEGKHGISAQSDRKKFQDKRAPPLPGDACKRWLASLVHWRSTQAHISMWTMQPSSVYCMTTHHNRLSTAILCRPVD